MGSGGSGPAKAWSTAVQNVNRPGTHGPRPRGTTALRHRINGEMMDEDTKLVLQMWRVQVMVNDHLQRRVDALERELEVRDVNKCIDVGDGFVPWRRVGRGPRRNPDSSD